jgi:hypothetical protein
MAPKIEKTEKAEKTDQRPPVVEDSGIKETFADDFVGLYGVGPNIHLTFATRRPTRAAPGVARVVSSRVVLPLEAAIELYGALHNAVASLESRGVVKRRPAPAKPE